MGNLYNKIEELCAARGITVTELSRQTNVSRGLLADLKTGRSKSISAKSHLAIANYFGIDPAYLIDDDSEPTPEMLEDIRTDAEKRILFQLLDGSTVEDVRKVIDIVKVLKGDTK